MANGPFASLHFLTARHIDDDACQQEIRSAGLSEQAVSSYL